MIINNKQVNIWRGAEDPPTLYHVWIKDDSKILLYNGIEWIIFIDDLATIQKVNELYNQVQEIHQTADLLKNSTINNKKIIDNPILYGTDLILNRSGTFVESSESISNNIIKIDTLLNTQIID